MPGVETCSVSLLTNSMGVEGSATDADIIRAVKVPMTEIAAEHENPKGANIVMMGAMAANSDLFTEDDLERLINEFFEKKGKINPKNSLCFRAGTQIH